MFFVVQSTMSERKSIVIAKKKKKTFWLNRVATQPENRELAGNFFKPGKHREFLRKTGKILFHVIPN
ncbi:uncharacterized protein LOC125769138 isoform X4 [Anopheles funestus]